MGRHHNFFKQFILSMKIENLPMTHSVLEAADYVLELDESIESLAKIRHKEDKEQTEKKTSMQVIIVRPPVHHGRAAASIVLRL